MFLKIIKAGLFAVILFFPVSLFIGVESRFEVKLPLVEPLLWFLLIIWLFYISREQRQKHIYLPPLPFMAFLLIFCLSSITSKEFFSSFREIVQLIDYYFIFYLLLVNTYSGKREQKFIACALFFLTVVVIVFSIIQFVNHGEKTFLISSLLDNRNILGTFLAIILPLFYGFLIHEKRLFLFIPIGIVIISGILINTAVGSLIILLLTLLIINLFKSGKRNPISLSLFTIIIVFSLFFRFDSASWKKYFFEPESPEDYHKIIEQNVGMIQKGQWLKGTIGKTYNISLSTSGNIPDYSSEEYKDIVKETREARSRDIFVKNSRTQVRQRWLEWQAALNMLGKYPLLGVGPGNYQKDIGYYFYTMPKLNTLEPDTQNGFLVIASTTGILGLSAFVWIFVYFFPLAYRNYNASKNNFEKGLNLGLLGALISFTVTNIFYNVSNHHATTLLFIIITVMIFLNQPEKVGVPEKYCG